MIFEFSWCKHIWIRYFWPQNISILGSIFCIMLIFLLYLNFRQIQRWNSVGWITSQNSPTLYILSKYCSRNAFVCACIESLVSIVIVMLLYHPVCANYRIINKTRTKKDYQLIVAMGAVPMPIGQRICWLGLSSSTSRPTSRLSLRMVAVSTTWITETRKTNPCSREFKSIVNIWTSILLDTLYRSTSNDMHKGF